VPEKQADGKIVFERRTVGRIGVVFRAQWQKMGVGESIVAGGRRAFAWVAVMLIFLREMATGAMAPEGGGPVAIAAEMSRAARMGLFTVLNEIGIISINFAVFNLLPIPVLDGGHLTILGYEAILRRRISDRSRTAVLIGGLIFIVGFFLLITARDIVDLVLQKFS
jgi:regulator of sigma E protease